MPSTMIGALVCTGSVGLVAAADPGAQAGSIDPMVVLREIEVFRLKAEATQ